MSFGLHLWEDTNKVWVKAQCDTDGYLKVHKPTNNYFVDAYNTFQMSSFPTDAPAASKSLKLPVITVSSDPLSKFDNSDWYGASGAYTQADAAGCSATNVRKTGAAFTDSLRYTLIRWASNAAGTANTGYGIITDRVDSDNITIYKATGSNFANNYYFWIVHAEWEVPISGTYILDGQVYWNPAEAFKRFDMGFCYIDGDNYPVGITSQVNYAVIAGDNASYLSRVVSLTEGWKVFFYARHQGTDRVPTMWNVGGSAVAQFFYILLLEKAA